MHSYICIVAPHLGALAEAREGPNVVPNQKMMFGGKNSDLSRISGKPRSIISLLISKNAIEYYMLYVLLH
jgi:hypothetical protein